MLDDKDHQSLYLGLDLSIEELKGVVIDEDLNIIAEEVISFNDKSLVGDVLEKNDQCLITTPVLVFLEALGKKNLKKLP